MIRFVLTLAATAALAIQNPGPSVTGATVVAAGHSFTVVQVSSPCSANSSSNTYITCTLAATAAGNQLIFACEGAATTITTSPSSSSLLTLYNGAYGYDYFGIASTVTPGTTSVTVTTGTYKSEECLLFEAHGVAASSPQDGSGSSFAAGSYGTSVSTGSVTTSNAADVVLGVVNAGAIGTCTAGAGYTLVSSSTYSTSYQTCLEYRQVSAAGSYNPSLSYTTGSATTVGTVALKLQ